MLCLSNLQESGDIARIDIMKASNGSSQSIGTAFSHIKNAWHDSGAQFSSVALPINFHVRVYAKLEFYWSQLTIS